MVLEFVLHALKITQEGAKIAMLLRLQFLEGSKRYLKLFETDPPKYVYLFVKRQKCFKNGILEPVGGLRSLMPGLSGSKAQKPSQYCAG